MNPNNPSRKRALPSWLKKAKSTKSSKAATSSNVSGFLDSNPGKKTPSTPGEDPTNAEDRTTQKSTFVPRNTVLFVMSEQELLETARLVLEEDDHSSSSQQQAENIEAPNEDDGEVVEEGEPQNAEPLIIDNDIPGVSDNTRNLLKDQDRLNGKKDSSHHKLKLTSKRRLDEVPSSDEDAMDVEQPSPVVGADPTTDQFTSGLLSVPLINNKDSLNQVSDPKMDSVPKDKTPSSTEIPTPKKRSKPNFSILDEIFF